VGLENAGAHKCDARTTGPATDELRSGRGEVDLTAAAGQARTDRQENGLDTERRACQRLDY